jgi:hypothetical protein
VEKFIHRENVALYKKHLTEPHTDAERKVLLRLLADEEATRQRHRWRVSPDVSRSRQRTVEATRDRAGIPSSPMGLLPAPKVANWERSARST